MARTVRGPDGDLIDIEIEQDGLNKSSTLVRVHVHAKIFTLTCVHVHYNVHGRDITKFLCTEIIYVDMCDRGGEGVTGQGHTHLEYG